MNRKPRASRITAILATILLALIPTTGMGNLASVANASVDPTDTTLSAFTVNGTSVTNNSSFTAPFGSTSVAVVATPNNPDASVSIAGNTGLSIGNNTLTVSVTSADTSATATNTVTIVVPEFNNDTSLSTFKVDGQNVQDGDTVTIAQGRTSVPVEAVTTDTAATRSIAGNTGLVPGDNFVTVTVTADDDTVKVYTVKVIVSVPSSVKSLSSVKVNGVIGPKFKKLAIGVT